MARIKVVVFVLLAVGLALAGLSSVSAGMGAVSQAQVQERLGWGKALFESSGKLAQALRTQAAAQAGRDAAVVQAFAKLNGETPDQASADAAKAALGTALEKLPAQLKTGPVYLVGTDKGVAALGADGQLKALAADAFGLKAAAQAGAPGANVVVDGALYRVAAAPVVTVENGVEKVLGHVGAGFALDKAFVVDAAKELTLGVTLLVGDKAESSLPDAAASVAAAAKNGPVELEPRPSLGPVKLPMFTDAALAAATSFPVADGAQVVLTADASTMRELVAFQQRGLFGLVALFALGIAFTLVAGGGAAEARPAAPAKQPEAAPQPAVAAAPSPSAEAPAAAAAEPASLPETGGVVQASAALEAAAEPAPVTPDDFPFGGNASPPPPPAVEAAPPPPPMEEMFAMPPPPPPAPEPEPAPAPMAFGDALPLPAPSAPPAADPFAAFGSAPPQQQEEPTGSYKAVDPFALAAAQMDNQETENQYHEATVVAAVPEQLLRATARKPAAPPAVTAVGPAPVGIPLPAPASSAPPPPAAANAEEAHFLDVFNQFVATKAQCNEPADGVTFDKFALKLRKNKEQLVAKYNCKTVRFQVYVKDGKAALKATPVKD